MNIWKLIKKSWSYIVRICTHKFIKFIFLRNHRFFYSRYLNSDLLVVTVIKNFISPSRFLRKVKYGCVKLLPKFLLSGDECPHDENMDNKVDDYLLTLRKNGFIIFEGAHPELAEYFQRKHTNFIKSKKPCDQYENLVLDNYDQKLVSLIANPLYLSIMSKYYNGRQPYLRCAPSLKATLPISKRSPTKKMLRNRSKLNCDWHFDTVNMLQMHFFLNDVSEKDTHMLYSLNSHSNHRVSINKDDYCYSDEYILSNYDVIPFIGKKGTVVLWDSNGIHCANPIPNRSRLLIQALYSPGNDILTKKGDSNLRIKLNLNLMKKLSPISKNIFKFISLDGEKNTKKDLRAKSQKIYYESKFNRE